MSEVNFRKPFERLSNVDSAKIIEVVEVQSIVGEGNGNGTPVRKITEYFSRDGELLARRDKYLDGPLEIGVWSNKDET